MSQNIPMILNDAGTIGLTLNGKSFPATAPITAKLGDWVQIDYFNEGLQAHPMHLHGVEQLVFAKDGIPLARAVQGGHRALSPGERYSVLVHADEPRDVGVPLPHPLPRRIRQGHVRHGHRLHHPVTHTARGLRRVAAKPVAPALLMSRCALHGEAVSACHDA